MKTLLKDEVSCFMLEDNAYVNIKDSCTELMEKEPWPGILYLEDFNTSNSVVVENIINVPEDWEQEKYLYTNGDWIPNPKFVPFRTLQ